MKKKTTPIAAIVALAIGITGIALSAPMVLAGRVTPGVLAGNVNFSGIPNSNIESSLFLVEQDLLQQEVVTQLRGKSVPVRLGEIGVILDREKTAKDIRNKSLVSLVRADNKVPLTIKLDRQKLSNRLERDFSDVLKSPVNASVAFTSTGALTVTPSQPGEVISSAQAQQQIQDIIISNNPDQVLELVVDVAPARITEEEATKTQVFANQIISQGIDLTFNDRVFNMKPFTVRRLLSFGEYNNGYSTGVQLDPDGLREYLNTTIVPEIDQTPQNARFAITEERVTQFSLPTQGQSLNIGRTISHISKQLLNNQSTIPLAVDITSPEIENVERLSELGLTSLLAVGESDYVGSPKNRVTNISVGSDRYHGLLIPPNTEFSFNEFLGPVSAKAGFLPELVIKNNVTTPEYGGGLCQVSTTIFRAALNAGLEITQRRNHSYAVSYYGTPGLDATIYPPYTDLRFLNNTPGYILIQRKIEGSKLIFEFWGTDDGREVIVSEPNVYGRQPNGAVKAVVEHKVIKGGEVIVEDEFYSSYKSPKLFPKVVAANGE